MKKFKLIAVSLALISAFSFFGCTPDNSAEKSNGDINKEIAENNHATNGEQDGEIKTETTPTQESEDTTSSSKTDEEETTPPLPDEVTGYMDVGDDYRRVLKPVYDALQTMLDDLIARKKVALPDDTAQITSLRYTGKSMTIYCSYFATIKGTGERSEFLKKTVFVEIENFNQNNDNYLSYKSLLENERKYEMNDKYVEKVLPLATEVAENLIEHYQTNKESFDVRLGYGANHIMLTAHSSLAEIHAAMIKNINDVLPKMKAGNFPSVTNHDISFSFGGNIYDEFAYSRMTMIVKFQNFEYTFYAMPFNDGSFDNDYMSYFNGEYSTGYVTPFDPVPTNSEYAEFFNALGIVNMELPLEFHNEPKNYFCTHIGDFSTLNFN